MITTQVTDTGRGMAAFRVPVQLDAFITGQGWVEVGYGLTNNEGRIQDFGEPKAAGVYRLMFDIAAYTSEAFFPSIAITFEVRNPDERYHVPLVLSPYGYSTHRESQ